jgi:hypothetical protein
LILGAIYSIPGTTLANPAGRRGDAVAGKTSSPFPYGTEAALLQISLPGILVRAGQSAQFPHESYLAVLTGLRDQLKAGLSGAASVPGAETPTVAERAERIKTLKAERTIKVAPLGTGKRQASAEQPVAARIW